MKSEEIMFQKVFVSPRPPPKICYKSNWMCDLDSDVANPNQAKPKTNYQVRGDPYVGKSPTKEIEKRTMFDHDTLSQEKT